VAVERESFQIVVRHCEFLCLRVFVMRGAWWKEFDQIESNRMEYIMQYKWNAKQGAVNYHLRKHPLD